jgi:acyl-CoA synthetase (AMP-forming)/AMP-acid ligase II
MAGRNSRSGAAELQAELAAQQTFLRLAAGVRPWADPQACRSSRFTSHLSGASCTGILRLDVDFGPHRGLREGDWVTALTAQRLVERSLRIHADRIALIEGDRRTSYEELAHRSARLANAMLAYGCSGDQPASSWLPNCAEYIEFDVACTRAGITRVGIGERLSGDECGYMLEQSGSRVLITTPELLSRLGAACVAALECVFVVAAEAASADTVAYEDALAGTSDSFRAPPVVPSAPCFLMYTSGTTGRAKGATISHGARVASTVNMLASELRHFGQDTVFVHAGPLTHGSGSKIMPVLAVGGTNLVLPRFTPEAFGNAIAAGGTHSFLVPTMLQRLLDASPDVHEAVRSIRQITFGGSPIAPSTYARALETFGPILSQIYGSSELPHPVTVLHPERSVGADETILISAGWATYGCDVKTVGEDGDEVAPGEIGELLVGASHAMTGYWRNPEATAQVFTGDGWYRSGDLATIGHDGMVTLQDRKRDLIISGGLNVYPSEVERVLAEHPGVKDCAVVGAPDPEWGETVVAYVIPASADVTEAELVQFVRNRLAGYKKPRRVVFMEAFPLGSSNKVLKRQLRDELWAAETRRVG